MEANNKTHIVIEKSLHKKLKIKAAELDKDIQDLATEIIEKALKEL